MTNCLEGRSTYPIPILHDSNKLGLMLKEKVFNNFRSIVGTGILLSAGDRHDSLEMLSEVLNGLLRGTASVTVTWLLIIGGVACGHYSCDGFMITMSVSKGLRHEGEGQSDLHLAEVEELWLVGF